MKEKDGFSNVCPTVNLSPGYVAAATEALSAMTEYTASFPFSLGPIVQALQLLSAYIAAIQTPDFSIKLRKKLADSYCAWGKCGWAWIGTTPLKFYYTPPLNIADANKRIEPYHSQPEIIKLFDRLCYKKWSELEKSDLDSAIFCYHNHQYKPCALVLFGIIDAELIRKQTTIGNYRPVGEKATKKLKEQFEQTDDNFGFFSLLRFANLFSCLETVFANGNNFKDEPLVINRNYIGHGMNQRPVLKRDCIQLFFILENLLDFFDYPLNVPH